MQTHDTQKSKGRTATRKPRPKLTIPSTSDQPVETPAMPDGSGVVVEDTRRVYKVVARVDKAWFVARLEDKGWSMRQLAEAMGLDVAALSRTFAGKRKMNAVDAGKIARILGEPVDAVLSHTGVDVRSSVPGMVAVHGWVDERGEVVLGHVQGPTSVAAPLGMPDGVTVLRVQGGRNNGWVLFYRESAGVRPEAVGRLCVVRQADGPAVVGWLDAGYELGVWHLTPLGENGRGREIAELVSASPVLWIKQ